MLVTHDPKQTWPTPIIATTMERRSILGDHWAAEAIVDTDADDVIADVAGGRDRYRKDSRN